MGRNGRLVLWVVVGLVVLAGAGIGVTRSAPEPDVDVEVVPADVGSCDRTYPYNPGAVPGVLALGDSYSSGEGLAGSFNNCYDNPTQTPTNECHRSAWAYSGRVLPTFGHQFWACSGALTADVLYRPKWGEVPQSFRTTPDWLVSTLTIGGNDVGFASVLEACAAVNFVKSGLTLGTIENIRGNVDGEVYHPVNAQSYPSKDCDGWLGEAEAAIGRMEDRLVETYLTLLEGPGDHRGGLGRGAKLLVGTYPVLFPSTWTGSSVDDEGHRFCEAANIDIATIRRIINLLPRVQLPPTPVDNIFIGFPEDVVLRIRAAQDTFNQVIRNAVNRIRTQVGDPRIRLVDLAANHPSNTVTCGDSGRPEPYVNAIRFAFDLSNPVSLASFHPNEAGQDAFGVDFANAVAGDVPFSAIDPAYDGAEPDPAPRVVSVGQPIDIQLRTVGGPQPSWELTTGELPDGVSFDAVSGRITGASTEAGGFAATFTATAGGSTDAVTVPLTVTPIAPCTKVWGRLGGGTWDDPTAWFPNGVPGPSDRACIRGTGTFGVTIDDPVTVANLEVRDVTYFNVYAPLVLTSGTNYIEALGGSGRVEPRAGVTLQLGDTPYASNVLGNQVQGAGTTVVQQGTTVVANGMTLETALVNQGTIHVQGSCSLGQGLTINAPFTNQGHMLIDGCVRSDESPHPAFVNATNGTITPTSNFAMEVPFDNRGRMVIPRVATVSLHGATLSNGVWTGGGTLRLTGASTLTTADLTGLGQLDLHDTLTTSGTARLPYRTDLYGTLARSGSGSYVVPPGSTLRQASTATLRAPLVNDGTIELRYGNHLQLDHAAASITNNGMITTGLDVDGYLLATAGATIVNTATGNIAPSPGRTLYIDGPVTNQGVVTLPADTRLHLTNVRGGDWAGAGTLALSGTMTAPSETVSLGAGTTELAGVLARSGSGSYVVPAGSTLRQVSTAYLRAPLTNSGTIALQFGHAFELDTALSVLTNNGLITTTAESDGYLRVVVGATLTNSATGNIAAGPGRTITIDGPMTNQGTVSVPSGTTLRLMGAVSGGTWSGTGVLEVHGSLAARWTGTGLLRVYGMLIADQAVTLAGTTELGGVLARSGSGSYVVPAGAVLRQVSTAYLRAPLTNNGTITLQFGHAFELDTALSVLTNNGLITTDVSTNSDGYLRVVVGATFTNGAAGSIAPAPGRTITIDGPMTNQGTVSVPSGTTLRLMGAVSGGTWSGTGVLEVHGSLAARWTGTGLLRVYGMLIADQAVTLAGTTELGGVLARSGSGSYVVPAGAVLRQVSTAYLRAPLTNNGTIALRFGHVFNLDTALSVLTNNGVITTDAGSDGHLTSVIGASFTNAAGGTIRPAAGRTVVIGGAMTNAGTIALPLGTTVRLDEPTLTSTSTIAVTVGPDGAGQLYVGGDLAVQGGLAITTSAGYAPPVGTSASFATVDGTLTGGFGSITGASIPGVSRSWSLTIAPPSISMVVVAGTPSSSGVPGDFDGNGTTDRAVYRPSTGRWFVEGVAGSVAFGVAGDVPVPGFYDADAALDRAVFRPSTGRWYVEGMTGSVLLGLTGDVPVPGQWDADAAWDLAVFRPSTGRWFVEGVAGSVAFGVAGDVPVPGFYDADAALDRAVFRPSTGRWYVEGMTGSVVLGQAGDVPIPAPIAARQQLLRA